MVTATTTAAAASGEHNQSFVSLSSLMNQSTIYRRHEARLARTYALKDDPRPAIIRVMSGLPGLRIIVPPYDPTATKILLTTTNDEKQPPHHQQHYHRHHHSIGDYSEETFFRAADNDDKTTTSNNNSLNIKNNQSSSDYVTALQAMFSTGVCCGVGQYVFGGHYKQLTSNNSSPFHNKGGGSSAGSSVYSPFIRGQGSNASSEALNVYFLMKSHNHHTNHANVSSTTTTTTTTSAIRQKPSSIILMAASNTSILFGSKIFLEHTLSSSSASSTTSTSSNGSYNVLSSAIAGGIVGMINSLMLYKQQKNMLKLMFLDGQQHPSSISSSIGGILHQPKPINYINLTLIGRHMVAATLYFGTYDCLTSWMRSSSASAPSSDDEKKNINPTNNTMSIVLGGGLAGLIYTSVIHQSQQQVGMLRVLPTAMIRAIPIHAMIFYGYETMKDGVRMTQ